MIFKGKCPECGGKLILVHNVGWDIDEDGEQIQHLQTCVKCDKERLVIEYFSEFYDRSKLSYGKMTTRD
jgi:hypothetical protein